MKWFKNKFKQLGQIIWKKKEVFPTTPKPSFKRKPILSRLKSWFRPKPSRVELPKVKPIVDRSQTQQKILEAIRSSKPIIKQEVPKVEIPKAEPSKIDKPILPKPTKPEIFTKQATTPQTPVKEVRQPKQSSIYGPRQSPIYAATAELKKLRYQAIDRGLDVKEYATMDKDELIYELTGREISELTEELEELHQRKRNADDLEREDIEQMEAILEQQKEELEARQVILETLDREQLEKLVIEEKIDKDIIDDAGGQKPPIDGEEEEWIDETT